MAVGEKRAGWYLWGITAAATLGGFLFGFDSGVISGAVAALREEFEASAAQSGWNVSSMLLGCAAGALAAGRLADRWGRLTVMKVAAVMFIISAWGSGIATGSMEFVIYRVIGGLAVGAASVICPAYVCEIAPPGMRGRLASLQQMAIVLGLFAAFLGNYLIAAWAGGAAADWWGGHAAWQWMFWSELGPAVVFAVVLFLIPESPRYLVRRGRSPEARKVLAAVLGEGEATQTVAEIEEALQRDAGPAASMSTRRDKVPVVVWVGVGLAMLQQLSGINIVFYYGPVMWQAAGFDESGALGRTLFSGFLNIACTLIAIALVDRVGRRAMLLLGAAMMTLALAGVATVFGGAGTSAGGDLQLGAAQGWWALGFANAYVAAFAITWGPVVWVLLGEMFPARVKGWALSVCGLAMWVANFGITISFESLLGSLGLGWTYAIYTAFAAVSVGFVWRMVPETKGRRLEEMDTLFAMRGSSRV